MNRTEAHRTVCRLVSQDIGLLIFDAQRVGKNLTEADLDRLEAAALNLQEELSRRGSGTHYKPRKSRGTSNTLSPASV